MDLMGFFEGLYGYTRKLAGGGYHPKKWWLEDCLHFSTRAPFSMLSSDFADVGFFFCGGRWGSVWSTKEWFLLKNGIGRFDDVKQSIRVNHMPFRKLPQHSHFFLDNLQEQLYGPKLGGINNDFPVPNLWNVYWNVWDFIGPSGFFSSLDACHYTRTTSQVSQSDLFGMVKWPFQGLNDLLLGNQKVTLNHLEDMFFFFGLF